MNTLIKVFENTIIDISNGMIAEFGIVTVSDEESFCHLTIDYPGTTKGMYPNYKLQNYIHISRGVAEKLWKYLCANAHSVE